MKKLILVVISVLILILFFSLFLSADVYVKVMERTEAFEMSGKRNPEKMEIKEQWLAKDKFAIFSKELNIIVDYQKEKIYFIVHKPKKYYEFPTSIDMTKLQKLIPLKAAEIISSIKISDVKVNLRGQKKKVANWNCQEIEFEMVIMIPALNIMPKFKMKLWATKDVPFDYKKYSGGMGEFYGKFVMELLNVDEKETYLVQELHLPVYHMLCMAIENELFSDLDKVKRPSPSIIPHSPLQSLR